jgi:hypothetical protein
MRLNRFVNIEVTAQILEFNNVERLLERQVLREMERYLIEEAMKRIRRHERYALK